MKYCASLVIIFLLLIPTQVFAQENWLINNFASDIHIQEDGWVSVVEKIDVDFGSEQKHGIFRDIPYVYTYQNGAKLYTEIKVLSVRDSTNSSSIPYETFTSGDYTRIKIGDPGKTISGPLSYRIEYTIAGVLASFADHDELYWNVTGNAWPVPISKASATVTVPKEGITKITCFEGPARSSEVCNSNQVSKSKSNFEATKGLRFGEGLTLVVGFEKGLVPIITVPPPKNIFDELFSRANILVFALVSIFGIGSVLLLWYQRGRDYWERKRFIDDPEARHEVRPIGAHETVVVEYTPPEKLRPAEIGLLMDERADTLDVTATIIDLAERGFLKIEEKPKKWVFGNTDYVFTKQNKDQKELLSYEKELLTRIFDGGETVKMSDLKQKFYEDLKKVKEKLYEEVVNKKFFCENPEKVRLKYLLTAIVITCFAGGLSWLGFALRLPILIAFCAGMLLTGVLLLVISQFMARKTAFGREMFRRAQGYELFVSTAEKHRQKFFENRNMFNEVMPYAIVFGLTEKFAKAFKDMELEPAQPSWYSGTGTFNAVVFGSTMSSFSNSLSSAMVSSPGGSGFSSGGSGGGFGGGGGGSW